MSINPNAYPEYPPRRPSLWSSKSWRLLIVLFFLFVLWVLFPFVPERIITSVTDSWHCLTTDCDPSGPPAPWAEQLAAAQAAIQKISSDNVLTAIEVRSAAYKDVPWNPDKALEIRFSYVITSGLSYEVRLLDSKPSTTARIIKEGNIPNSRGYEEALANSDALNGVSSLALGPRQATERIWSLLRDQGGVGDIEFFRGSLVSAKEGWRISLHPVDFEQSVKYSLTLFTVDAMTGEITARTLEGEIVPLPIAPTPTP